MPVRGSQRRQHRELHPEFVLDARIDGDVEVGSLAGVVERGYPRAFLAIHFAESQRGELSDLLDHAGLGDVRADACHARHDVARSHDLAHPIGTLDAVLEREDRGATSYQAPQAFGGGLGVAHLHREQDGIGLLDLARVSGNAHLREREFSQFRIEPQALGLHGLQMAAARDECDVIASRSKARAEVAADAARPHHNDLHDVLVLMG